MSALPATAGNSIRPSAFLAPIAGDLVEVERIMARKLASHRGHVARVVAHLDHYRGKRLRPALLLFSARACGKVVPAHQMLGAVVEMIHTATLVHDDVLDEADMRRHVRTVNAGWGNHTSILLGDMLFSHAFHLASSVDARACEIIGRATNRVCEGELHQIAERGNTHLTEEAYLDMIDGKTAELTSCCCRLGALYAGADEQTVESLAHYGRNLGMAFQIADDLLDFTGMEDATGKTLGTDLAQKKLTLPVIHMLSTLPAGEAENARASITGTASRESIAAHLRQTGSLAYARGRAEEYAAAARDSLNSLPLSEWRALLSNLTDWSLRREK